MLQKLHIRNYILMDELEVHFKPGFTILTGETGAGKSILLGALSLLLGERADAKVVLNTERKCVLEAHFNDISTTAVPALLEAEEIECGEELILRREISGQGKSRVFINDTPSTLQVLQRLAVHLVDMHRQQDTPLLREGGQQLRLLDEVGQHTQEVARYRHLYSQWRSAERALQQLREQNQQLRQEQDYHEFLYEELNRFQPQRGELEQLEQQLTLLLHQEALRNNLQAVLQLMQEGEEPVLQQLKRSEQLLEPYEKILNPLSALRQRLASTRIELRDVTAELQHLLDAGDSDEEQIRLWTERLQEGFRLMKKHGARDSHALVDTFETLKEKLSKATLQEEEEQRAAIQCNMFEEEMQQQAAQLTRLRAAVIPLIESKVKHMLEQVGMPRAVLQIRMQAGAFQADGRDEVEMWFDANQTGHPMPLGKVASGGELSRLMLCMKSLLAHARDLPTLVFDEIDTGISGETAMQVGQIMQGLSQRHQLICITHLPQIAARGNQHLYIYKQEDASGALVTHLRHLNEQDRVQILAEMLSGKSATTETHDMARQLMRSS